MTTEDTTQATEEPKHGLAAVDKILTAHFDAKDAAAKEDEEDEDDEEKEPRPAPGATTKAPRTGKKIRDLRQGKREALAKAAALEAELARLRAAPPSPAVDLELAKKSPLAALERLGLSREEALDAVQKEAIQAGALPPAVAKAVGALQEQLDALQKRNAELEAQREEREAMAAHEAGMRALRQEATDLKTYPELEGYDWETELTPAIEQAIDYLVAQNPGARVAPAKVIGLVNAAFKVHHEKLAKRGKLPPGATPAPPPAPKKPAPQLPPVVAGKKGKVTLPTMEELQRRVARAGQQRVLRSSSLTRAQPPALCPPPANGAVSVGKRCPAPRGPAQRPRPLTRRRPHGPRSRRLRRRSERSQNALFPRRTDGHAVHAPALHGRHHEGRRLRGRLL